MGFILALISGIYSRLSKLLVNCRPSKRINMRDCWFNRHSRALVASVPSNTTRPDAQQTIIIQRLKKSVCTIQVQKSLRG
jgi:hypothetical protein